MVFPLFPRDWSRLGAFLTAITRRDFCYTEFLGVFTEFHGVKAAKAVIRKHNPVVFNQLQQSEHRKFSFRFILLQSMTAFARKITLCVTQCVLYETLCQWYSSCTSFVTVQITRDRLSGSMQTYSEIQF